MEVIASLANGFMELFKAGATTFSGWVAGIIPLIAVLTTAVNACIKLIGEDRVDGLARKATKKHHHALYGFAGFGSAVPGQPDDVYVWSLRRSEV